MSDIEYMLTFHTYWHCGSGLAAGADVDLLVVKDASGLPFVPGRTVKGLLREAAERLLQLAPSRYAQADIEACMGKYETESDDLKMGASFFGNACLPEVEQEVLMQHPELAEELYDSVSATAINAATGTVREHSLRKMQVVVPCQLQGRILHVPDSCMMLMADSLKMVKRLGLGRNRGWGRCTFQIKNLKA